jgi:hypothetical protein
VQAGLQYGQHEERLLGLNDLPADGTGGGTGRSMKC